MLLDICRRQWNALRRTDHFRREGVSNLSHDLRSPLTATVACLETLDGRWAGDAGARRGPPPGRDRAAQHAQRRRHGAVARRPGQARRARVRPAHARRSTPASCSTTSPCASPSARRARASRCARRAPAGDGGGPRAELDVELFERAIANLVDNALKFCPRGSTVTLAAERARRPRRGERRRRRAGHSGRRSAAAVRPLLSEPAVGRAGDCRRRPRPRPGDRQAHRRAARRRRRGRERARRAARASS